MKDKVATLREAEEKARVIGRRIKGEMPTGWGFSLVLYSFGEGGAMTYLSSGNREDCIKMFKELLENIETNKPNIGE